MRLVALEAISSFSAEHAAAAVIGRDGVISSYGDDSYRFELASVTKLLSAYATLAAVDGELVALDGACGPHGSTLEHLLSHASGLSPDDETLVLSPPGTRRIYSNAGFEALGRHVAERVGIDFSDYLRSAVLAPLSMEATNLVGSPARGAVASLSDLTRFATELLAPSLVSQALARRATSVAFAGLVGVLPGFGRQEPCDWGLGFEIKDAKSRHWTGTACSTRTFGHFGQAGSFLLVDPDAELSLVFLSDRGFGPWAKSVWPAWIDDLYGELGLR